jgi:transcriptional regulator with XRE-family HTH domain
VKSIDPEARAVGDAVGAIRRALGWSQGGLALRAGVSQSHVADIENRRPTHLTFETAVKLLAAMGGRLTVAIEPPSYTIGNASATWLRFGGPRFSRAPPGSRLEDGH